MKIQQTRRFLVLFTAFLPLLVFTHSANAQQKNSAERLGYPADAKLVILHADDLAVAHSVDQASFAALDQKAVISAQSPVRSSRKLSRTTTSF